MVFAELLEDIDLQLALVLTTGSYARRISRDKYGGLLPMTLIPLLAGTMFGM